MQRRHVLKSTGTAGLLAAVPNIARSSTGRLRYSVWRKGDEIGSHDMRFTQTGDELIVDIDIVLNVKLLFIPVYDYKHHNQERWQSGQLAGFESETDDNGDEFKVSAKNRGDVIVSQTRNGEFEHPAGRRPTTYWHKDFLRDTNWIDTQKGSGIACELVKDNRERIDVLGQETETDHFELTGDLRLNLWYHGDDWVKLTFRGEDDSIIEYRIVEFNPVQMSFA